MKRFVLLLVMAFVGAGMAYGAASVFFSPASEDVETVEPAGIVDDLGIEAPDEATPEPSPTPTATPAPESNGTTTAPVVAAPAPAATKKPDAGSTVSVQNGEITEDGDDLSPIERECVDEDNEAARDRCEERLEAEAEADADEEEAEREAEEQDAPD